MNIPADELATKEGSGAVPLSVLYRGVDCSITPERFTSDAAAKSELAPELSHLRSQLLANQDLVARIKAYTMHGDPIADAYAALIPQYGFRRLANMLEQACAQGVESVASAPVELARFVQAMEQFPSWLDSQLIDEGARLERNAYAHRAPFALRGALIGTFMNKYSALPMALTGALSNKTAARRAKETATFFTTTVLPGALGRYGVGFKSAAMVRLMHSMVRFNVLARGEQWDTHIYGMPIPQIDQMPVALLPAFALAQNLLGRGRTSFSAAERARVDLARYRGFLLGLPAELLPDTPQEIVDIMLTRFATLRRGFDETCRALVAATMSADLSPDHSLHSRLHAWMERGFSKLLFVRRSVRGDRRAAADVGVRLSASDYFGASMGAIWITSTMAVYNFGARIPIMRQLVDRSLVRALTRQLARYGHAEFRTNADNYRPGQTSSAAQSK
jgi:hypothetical protein